jgi:hypothetical protein
MSLWGKYDAKTVAGSVTVTAANATVIGVGTTLTNFQVGDYLNVGDNDYVFTAIANATVATVRSGIAGGSLVGAQSNSSYVVSEKPKFVTYSEAANAGGDPADVYGAAVEEMQGTSSIASIAVTAAGSGFTVRPTATITDSTGSGSGATATATAKVVTFTVGSALDADAGTGYANGDVIKVDGGTGTSANATVTTGASNTSVASLTVVNGGAYTVLPSLTGEATIAETGSGSGLLVDLTMGLGSVTVTASGNNYATPAVTIGGTGGVGATAAATLSSTEAGAVAHAGWVRRTVGTGGRSGRVSYEVLVAGSSITGDAEDDTQLPE